MIHELKIWPDHFHAVASRAKTAEMRLNDRNFREYDTIVLQEYMPHTQQYTGRIFTAIITHVLTGEEWGIRPGFCMISFRNGFLTKKKQLK